MTYPTKRLLVVGLVAFILAQAMGDTSLSFAEDTAVVVGQREQEQVPSSAVDLEGKDAKEEGAVSASKARDVVEGWKVVEIEVRGNRVVSSRTILSKMRTHPGELLRPDTIKEDIKRLYATGFFQDVRTEMEERDEGYKVIVLVDEKPIVQEVIIEGSTKFGAEDLRKELKIIDGQVLNDFELREGIEAIQSKYQAKGYRFVDIQPEVDVSEETKEAVVYILINEGAVYKIREITLNGVTAFKERKIRRLFRTKKAGFLRSGTFREDRFRSDLERVRSFYQQRGFLDVSVKPTFSYDDEHRRIDIVVEIDEGNAYVTGKVDIQGNVLFPESEIWQELNMLPGLTYSQIQLAEDVDGILRYYYERGYIDALVTPDVQLNTATGKVDVTYRIEEGDLFFVDQIKIRGNTKTKDLVIRRELLVFPGERFDGKKVERSKTRLEDLGYFEEVAIVTEEGSASNRRNLVVRVKEKRTGELSFGAGISSVEQFVGFAEVSQRNFDFKNFPTFTGGGQLLSVRGRAGSVRQDLDIRFVEPYVFNKPYSFGVNAYSRTRQKQNVDYEEGRIGFSIDVGKRFSETIRSGIGYTLEDIELTDIEADASPDVTASGTDNLLSRLRWSISRDTRDSRRKPTYGSMASFAAELIGAFLGGDQDLVKFQVGFVKYFMMGRHHFEWANRVGVVDVFGDSDQVPVFERFFAGGLGSVRGFDPRRVGPVESGDAIGGNTLLLTSLEYTIPIIENFRGAFFVDAGHVNEASWNAEFSDIAVSIGPGVKINTPIGPVAFYYGFPIANADEKNENGRFEFSLSRGF